MDRQTDREIGDSMRADHTDGDANRQTDRQTDMHRHVDIQRQR